ncbi:MAG: 50S ribosomal protein L11 methyltransferase [Hyphomicrobiaceae bacterium]
MTVSRVSVEVPGATEARTAAVCLEDLADPPASATTLFEIAGTPRWRVDAYFEDAPDTGALAAMLAGQLGCPVGVTLEQVPDENWVVVSQKALPPVHAGRFIVHGSHDRALVGHRMDAIEIDAGEAFGTAHHATTFGCLSALEWLTRQGSFARVLDLGCGSGVLAIAAAKAMPEARILASDIDPIAVDVARENARRNRQGHRVRLVVAKGLEHPSLRAAQSFDLILANILAGPLIALAPKLRRALAPRGVAVLSGILAEQTAEVEAAYRAVNLPLLQKRIRNGWATLVLQG